MKNKDLIKNNKREVIQTLVCNCLRMAAIKRFASLNENESQKIIDAYCFICLVIKWKLFDK